MGHPRLGAEDRWQVKLSPLGAGLLPTGQKILFRGADMPEKIKSTKFEKGLLQVRLVLRKRTSFTAWRKFVRFNQSLLRGRGPVSGVLYL